MWLFLALLGLPLVEIALFIVVGGAIGVAPTLLWVIGSAAAGLALMRKAGIGTMQSVRDAMDGFHDPHRPLADGALRIAGALLLVLPGFLTDAAGLLLLVPRVRSLLLRRIAAPVRSRHPAAARVAVIEADYVEVAPDGSPGPRRGSRLE